MKISKQKLKQIGVVFSLLVLSNKDINSKEINNILNNVSETYIEIGNPEYGDYLRSVYDELPEYIKNFLEKNYMRIIVMENHDDIEKLYQDIYPSDEEAKNFTGLTIAENLIALVEGCSHDDNIRSYLYQNGEYTADELNKFDLRQTMLHQIGHLVDIYYNYLSKSNDFINKVYRTDIDKFRFQLSSFYNNVNTQEGVSEFFASIFSCYVLNPIYLKKNFLSAYQYMDNLVNTLMKENINKSK